MKPKGPLDRREATPSRMESENEVEDMDDGESGLSEDDGGDDQDQVGEEAGEDEANDGETESSEEEEEEEEEEDSSDMDVGECEKKKVEYIDDLTDLEKQFAILREQLYRERLTQIETKLTEVRSGKAPEYLQPLEELQVNMKNRMEVSTVVREMRLRNINCKFEAEQLATEQNFQVRKIHLYRGSFGRNSKAQGRDKNHCIW